MSFCLLVCIHPQHETHDWAFERRKRKRRLCTVSSTTRGRPWNMIRHRPKESPRLGSTCDGYLCISSTTYPLLRKSRYHSRPLDSTYRRICRCSFKRRRTVQVAEWHIACLRINTMQQVNCLVTISHTRWTKRPYEHVFVARRWIDTLLRSRSLWQLQAIDHAPKTLPNTCSRVET